MKTAVNYFKDLFTSSRQSDDDTVYEGVPFRISSSMNEHLLRDFTVEEINDALREMGLTKAPGYDGFHVVFFQKFWHIIGQDVAKYCLKVLNREISLNESLFGFTKKISKTIANRLKMVLDQLISDNILVAYEVLHVLQRRSKGKKSSFALKLDMSKAYDRMEWGFLEGMMTHMGFATEWISLVMHCISSVSYTVNFNGFSSERFFPQWGLRQSDPLSPYLFLICTEGFSSLLDSAVQMGNLRGVKYESASGQKLNLDKSQIFFSFNASDNSCNQLVQMLGVRRSLCMERYLGLPRMVRRRKKDAFQYICDRMRMKVQSWGARLLFQGGKNIFIKVVLQAIPIYSMSCFLLPKMFCMNLESIMSHFLWQKSSTRRGIHWCNWASLNLSKNCGGMGFRDLGKFNIALLAKQGWRLVTNLDSLLGPIYKAKYYHHTLFWNATLGNNLSYAWKSIYAARKLLEDGIGWRVGSRSQISILQARWFPRWAGGNLSYFCKQWD
ncbi:reverse transcriptase [Gossypium australe]|uniref:Reverse transcriptase n=1 Tax=Gossypium australe TaxID=47621 RepID=A0A5B6UUM6_9ROSI|nr:reverse transcriptase [Gossypium australe]